MIDDPKPVPPIDVSGLTAEASRAPLTTKRVQVDDPLPMETHPYRPSVDRKVAALCSDPACDCLYAVEREVHDGAVESASTSHDSCPRCGATNGFAVRRVIRGIDEESGRAFQKLVDAAWKVITAPTRKALDDATDDVALALREGGWR